MHWSFFFFFFKRPWKFFSFVKLWHLFSFCAFLAASSVKPAAALLFTTLRSPISLLRPATPALHGRVSFPRLSWTQKRLCFPPRSVRQPRKPTARRLLIIYLRAVTSSSAFFPRNEKERAKKVKGKRHVKLESRSRFASGPLSKDPRFLGAHCGCWCYVLNFTHWALRMSTDLFSKESKRRNIPSEQCTHKTCPVLHNQGNLN